MRGRRTAAGLVGAVVLVAAACDGGGFEGDPVETVVQATAATLTLPIGVEFELTLDPDGLRDAARAAGDDDAAMGFGMLGSEPLVLSGDLVIAEGVVHLEFAIGGEDAGGLRLDEGQPPLLRLDADATRDIALVSFLRGMAPQLFTGEWVEVTGVPAPTGLTGIERELAELREELRAASGDELRDGVDATYLDTDGDGWRFEVRSGPLVDDVPSEVIVDVWVRDERVERLRADVLMFLLDEEPGLDADQARDAAVVDLRRRDLAVPSRPDATSSVPVDRLGF